MSSQSIVCATCAAPVPYGRLSCPACGELLASVAGAARPAVARAMAKRATKRATPAVLVDALPLRAAAVMPEPAGTATLEWEPAGWDTPRHLYDPIDNDELEPLAGSEPAPDELADAEWEPSVFQAVPDSGPAFAAVAAAPVEWPADAMSSFAAPYATPPPALAAAAAATAVASPADATLNVPSAPGAYVPPVLSPELAGPPAPARAWAGQPATGAATPEAGAPKTSLAADLLDATRVSEFIGWLAVAGSAMAAVGFLLPWGISVIGAQGIGYFDRWGLAGPFHPIVLLGLLTVLGLSLVRNPIPLWARVGLPGFGLAALLLGLTWPYLLGLSGTGAGTLVVVVGALILGVAGVAALVTDRHAPEDRSV